MKTLLLFLFIPSVVFAIPRDWLGLGVPRTYTYPYAAEVARLTPGLVVAVTFKSAPFSWVGELDIKLAKFVAHVPRTDRVEGFQVLVDGENTPRTIEREQLMLPRNFSEKYGDEISVVVDSNYNAATEVETYNRVKGKPVHYFVNESVSAVYVEFGLSGYLVYDGFYPLKTAEPANPKPAPPVRTPDCERRLIRGRPWA